MDPIWGSPFRSPIQFAIHIWQFQKFEKINSSLNFSSIHPKTKIFANHCDWIWSKHVFQMDFIKMLCHIISLHYCHIEMHYPKSKFKGILSSQNLVRAESSNLFCTKRRSIEILERKWIESVTQSRAYRSPFKGKH